MCWGFALQCFSLQKYCIRSIRRRGYYYFNTQFCAASIWERRLLKSGISKICRETARLDTNDLVVSDPCADVEEDEDELKENELVLADC